MVSQILSSKNLNMLMKQNLESLFALWMDKDFQLVSPSSVSMNLSNSSLSMQDDLMSNGKTIKVFNDCVAYI